MLRYLMANISVDNIGAKLLYRDPKYWTPIWNFFFQGIVKNNEDFNKLFADSLANNYRS